ncbi:MAG: FprA family A-type flavoprotein [Clostridia bacterium]|nr:FprA family A-type flavoprotein [Clostridia bacterium]
MKITDNIKYIGVDDTKTDLFEGQFIIPDGIKYNSYVINDEKVAIMDSVDKGFTDSWLANIRREAEGDIDYLVVLHMEPDHSSSIYSFAREFPNAKIVSSQKSFQMMKGFFGDDFENRQIVVKEGDTLCLGKHTLRFFQAPMVHWPEVMVAYEEEGRILFSADAFGKFGISESAEDWSCEARRYYFGIVGKYGMQVQALLKKIKGLEISKICPLHGPILSSNLSYYINLYDIWSSYEPEDDGVFIAYTSVYGNTKKAVKLLYNELKEMGCPVSVSDLARDDMAEAVEDAFRYSKLVLATTTYNNDIFPFMREFINHLTERLYQKRTVAFIENGSWMPNATKVMKSMLEKSKSLSFANTEVKIISALNEESISSIKALARELSNK